MLSHSATDFIADTATDTATATITATICDRKSLHPYCYLNIPGSRKTLSAKGAVPIRFRDIENVVIWLEGNEDIGCLVSDFVIVDPVYSSIAFILSPVPNLSTFSPVSKPAFFTHLLFKFFNNFNSFLIRKFIFFLPR